MKVSIIEFTVENFKIFKEKATFSMSARKSNHTFISNDQHLLRTSLIYGPNASGKSSILKAFSTLKNRITNSTNGLENTIAGYKPFILSENENQPVFFEVVFSLEKKIFRYNFSFNKNEIISENLFEVLPSGDEKEQFNRAGNKIQVKLDFKSSKDVADVKTRKEVLFLYAASEWNNKLAMQIVNSFKNINVISSHVSDKYGGYTLKLIKESSEMKNKILDYLRRVDFCIKDVIIEKIRLPDSIRDRILLIQNAKELPTEIDTIYFSHNKYNSEGQNIGSEKLNIGDESDGTQKFFEILGPVVDTLENGKVLFVDEFDNSIHPLLTKLIVDLFENNNYKNAQFIATTHDTTLLSHPDLNKEQFWFTEKNKFGAAKLYSLAEFDIRNDTEFAKKYLEGRFGALPFINY